MFVSLGKREQGQEDLGDCLTAVPLISLETVSAVFQKKQAPLFKDRSLNVLFLGYDVLQRVKGVLFHHVPSEQQELVGFIILVADGQAKLLRGQRTCRRQRYQEV